METKHSEVEKYYSEELKTSEDLKTNACCTMERPEAHIRKSLSLIHDEVQAKYYGCGLCIPDQLEGLHIIDLGSGSGRDCYLAADMVGASGTVTGIDMTDAQLAVANAHIEYHREKFGYTKPNTLFIKGNLDKLADLSLEKGKYDLIISNCVINLCLDKPGVLKAAWDLLKEGGELYFSDVYADRRIPTALQKHPQLWGECLSGALYWNDFLNYAQGAGFTDPRVVKSNPITVENEELQTLVGDIAFHSVTYRLWKLSALESDCEDYGQSVRYLGTVPYRGAGLALDDHHYFPKGKMMTVCGNTYRMLNETRFKDHFEFFGNWDTHYGIFEGCGGQMPFSESTGDADGEACC